MTNIPAGASARELSLKIESLGKALDAASRVSGPHAPQAMRLHRELANLLTALNHHGRALPHRELLVQVAIAREGEESEEYADAAAAYAHSLDQLGEYADAQRYYGRALAVGRRLRGEAHPQVITLRLNLAELARVRAELELAASRFNELEELQARLPDLCEDLRARILVGYALTLMGLHDYEESALRLESALEIRAKASGVDSPAYARVVFAQAQLQTLQQRHESAAAMYEQVYACVHDQPGCEGIAEEAQVGLAISRVGVDKTAVAMDAAETLLLSFAERRPDDRLALVSRWRNLARALVRIGEFARARRVIERTDLAIRAEMIEALRSQLASRGSGTMDYLRREVNLHLSLLLAEGATDAGAVRWAYEMHAALSGAETTALRLRSRRFSGGDASDTEEQMQELRSRITKLQLALATSRKKDQLKAELGRTQRELEDLELYQSAVTNEARLDLEFFLERADTIAESLPEGSALIEFTTYSRLLKGAENPFSGKPGYAAFVLRKGMGSPRLVDLGLSDPIDALIDRFRSAVREHRSRGWYAPGVALERKLLEPLRSEIAGMRHLVIVPAGRICVLPFASLPLDEKRFVIDEFDLAYRVSSRRLQGPLWEEDMGRGTAPTVIGAPDYGVPGGSLQLDPLTDPAFLGQFRSGARFDPLPESAGECRAIAGLLDVAPLLGADATEDALRELRSPEILHIATHGFYLEERKSSGAVAAPGAVAGPAEGRSTLSDPLERSGLAFAGANRVFDEEHHPPGERDGIVYAAEVAGLDFMHTDLLTLSACQSGLGDVRSGDGMHGLQRAFTTAGARCILCSLWDVPEIPTRKLFTRFYEAVLSGRERGEAFSSVLRELAAEYEGLPVAWGGFVLYGATDALPRFNKLRQLRVASFRMPGAESSEDQGASALEEAQSLMDQARGYAAERNARQAVACYTKVLGLKHVPSTLRAFAVYERAGVYRWSQAFELAFADYDWLASAVNVPERLRRLSTADRGTAHLMAGQFQDAVAAFSEVLAWQGLDADARAFILVNRASAWAELNHWIPAMIDFAQVIETPGMPVEQVAKALAARAALNLELGLTARARADALGALEHPQALAVDLAAAHINLGRAYAAMGEIDNAAACYDQALQADDIPPRFVEAAKLLKARLSDAFAQS